MTHFPIIDHIDQIREAIKGRDEFIIKHDAEHGLLIANYLVNFEDTFPRIDIDDPVERRRRQLLRECRGIVFDEKTGTVLARRYHKFRNLNETDEYQVHRINWGNPHKILQKLDGSMITPIMIKNQVLYGTKMGVTDIANQAAEFANRGISIQDGKKVRTFYDDFSFDLHKSKLTPIFEWCSRKQRIVIDYPDDQLVLTAIRHNHTGAYMTFDQLHALAHPYRVPVVEAYNGTLANMEQFLEHVRSLKNEEGYVIRFDDGNMVKVKAEEYCELHKTLDALRWEKDVLSMLLHDKADDAKALLAPDVGERLDKFGSAVFKAMRDKADKLYWVAIAAHDNCNGSRKRIALDVAPTLPHHDRGLMFKILDNMDGGVDHAYDVVKDYVMQNIGTSTKVDAIRKDFLGNVVWQDTVVGDD